MTKPNAQVRSVVTKLHDELVEILKFRRKKGQAHSNQSDSAFVRECLTRSLIHKIRSCLARGKRKATKTSAQDPVLNLAAWHKVFKQDELRPYVDEIWVQGAFSERNLAEQLSRVGFIYEILLSLDHALSDTSRFGRDQAKTRRHREGVHFTPDPLSHALVQTTFDRLFKSASPSEQALLALRIFDPAMGCGALLIQSVEQLARVLCELRHLPAGKGKQCSMEQARRDVVRSCIYGLDIHPPTVSIARLLLSTLAFEADSNWLNLSDQLRVGDSLQVDAPGRAPAVKLAQMDVQPATRNLRLIPSPPRERPPQRNDGNEELVVDRTQKMRWDDLFPQVWMRENRGFDFIIANPPFGTIINNDYPASSDAPQRWRQNGHEVAVGAFDKASLFASLTLQLLKPGGRYGLFLPRSVLAGGRASIALQKHVNSHGTPSDFFLFENPRLFDGANVFVAAIAGNKGQSSINACLHRDLTDTSHFEPSNVYETWWEMLLSPARNNCPSLTAVPLIKTSDLFTVGAGCATAAAYDLLTEITDSPLDEGLELITTGLIDRFAFRWGQQKARYLKNIFGYPRWPAQSVNSRVSRAALRQCGPKILVGGLTKTLEAAYDASGTRGGVVSTWVVKPRAEHASPMALPILEVLLNSWVVSWHYHLRHGAQQSPWGGMTIKKQGLLDLKLPADLFESQVHGGKMLAREQSKCDPSALVVNSLHASIGKLNDARAGSNWPEFWRLDREIQPEIASLYGYSEREFRRIALWYSDRAKKHS